MGLPRERRLTRGSELQKVGREGKRLRSEHIEGRAVTSLQRRARVGFVVPKYGNSGVERNRLKRRLRELARTLMLPRLAERDLAVDVVLRVRPSAYRASFDALRAGVERITAALLVLRLAARPAPGPPGGSEPPRE